MDRKGVEKTKDAKVSSKDIWAILEAMSTSSNLSNNNTAKEDQVQPQELANEEKDTYTLIVGSKSSGKSSLIQTFRNSTKVEEIKPTIALDYVPVKFKARPSVAHIWELAGTKCLPDFAKIPLSPERILNGALIIVLDLAAPGDVVPYLTKWLHMLYKVQEESLRVKSKMGDESAVKKLRAEAVSRYGPSHPDRDEVTPIALPIMILGNKYEVFREEDTVKRKGIIQAIRYIAHMYGATLLFTSTKDKNLATQFRTIMKTFALRAGPIKGSKEVDVAKAQIFVPAGSDLFEDIGFPKTARRQEFSKDEHEARANQWKKIVMEYYPASGEVKEQQEDENDEKTGEEREKFPEANIDRMVQRKNVELQRYRENRKKNLDKRTKAP